MDLPSSTVRLRRWTDRVALAPQLPPRVLVVDDNVNAADALATYLGLFGLSTKTAYSGRAAVVSWLEWRPAIVLLDISMPDLDGFTVARMMREDSRSAETVVVALTAHDESFVSQQASSFEFDGYCQKGNMLTALTSFIGELLHAPEPFGHQSLAAPKSSPAGFGD
jgi:two-component system OmpR family response regulator